jgi:hypothetical protein
VLAARAAHLELKTGDTKMLSKTKDVALSAAIVFSTVFPASAATKHHRVTHVYRPIYNMVAPAAVGGGCPANGGPGCSTEGQSAPPDSW